MDNHSQPLQPETRFSNRVTNYAKYRPSYPEQIIGFLETAIGLQKEWVIADIGSGTGIFSELPLRNGYRVYGVEPNKAMREEAEKNLVNYEKFTSIDGKGEQTSLDSNSIDLITIAQAFHWMNNASSKKEFNRVLRPHGFLCMLWNKRLTHTPFLKAYEDLKINFGTDYKATRMARENDIKAFFDPEPISQQDFFHVQLADYEALLGQLLSSSYIPLSGETYEPMMAALKDLFNKYNDNGFVKIEYDTKLYVNR